MVMKSFLPLVVVLSLSQASYAAKEVVDKVIATVNSEVILLSDLKKLQGRMTKPGAIDESLLLGESLEQLKTDKKAQMQFLIREKLIASEIKKQGLTATKERVESELEQKARQAQMTRAEFNNFIQKQGLTVEEYKELLKNQIERQSFFASEIVSKLRITDEDALGEYQSKNPNFRSNVHEYTIAQIFFDPKKTGGEAALARAKASLAKIRSGESFEAVANRESEDGGSKDGVLGTFKTGEFNPEIEAAVSNLAVNSTTDVVKSKQGFHIFKLLKKTTSTDPTFEKYKEQIKASLIEKNFSRQLKNWFESKKQDAYITTFETT